MGIFLIGGHWPKILPQNSKGASKMCVLSNLKFVPGWPSGSFCK
jgi:hypothetical protein